MPPYSPDDEDLNADWAKGSWDLWNADGTPVTTLEQLRVIFFYEDDARYKAMLSLPSAHAMPASLRRELEAL